MTTSSQTGSLFTPRRRGGVRVVVTGQVGVDKRPYLEHLRERAAARNQTLKLYHLGEMMYAEAPDVVRGRILDLPLGRLHTLRRAVFKQILNEVERHPWVVVNTHASFRWKHGLFPAFDHDQMVELDADLYITLVDNLDAIHERLQRDHPDTHHALKDVMVWREEEILATEVLAQAIRGHGCFYVFARGIESLTVESLYRLIFKPQVKRVYPSFPMTHVMDMPATLAEIDSFRSALNEHFITFDPGDLDEKRMLVDAERALARGEERFTMVANDRPVEFDAREVTSVARDIDGQIYARDFKLIDQADMIVSLVPELPDGKPGLSSGVERELQHAYEGTKEVYVIWQPRVMPSPFITETATRVFKTTTEALQYFHQRGYIKSLQTPLFEQPAEATPRDRGRFG